MSRLMGLVLAAVCVAAGESAHAQAPLPVNGGFGFDYAQPIPANGYALDRWWWAHGTPTVGDVLPPSTAVQPQPAAAQPAQPAHPVRVKRAGRTGRSFSRVTPRPYNRAGVQPGAPLPTGSLYWPATSGMPIYSPSQRVASYDQGYGVSPYGSAYYGALYKGMYWGN